MAIATYKDLCTDAVDATRLGRFWGAALALEPELLDAGATLLRSPDDEISWHVLADPEGNQLCAFTETGAEPAPGA